jgi:hypothetical protein
LPYGMSLSPKSVVKKKDVGFIYVTRSFPNVAKSIFNLKERFGLDVTGYDIFLKKTYKEMWTDNLKVDVIKQGIDGSKQHVKTVSKVFRGIPLTPIEYFNFHRKSWKLDAKNVHIVSYDNVLNNFNEEMLKVAAFLGSDVREFKNIQTKVGWKPHEA